MSFFADRIAADDAADRAIDKLSFPGTTEEQIRGAVKALKKIYREGFLEGVHHGRERPTAAIGPDNLAASRSAADLIAHTRFDAASPPDKVEEASTAIWKIHVASFEAGVRYGRSHA